MGRRHVATAMRLGHTVKIFDPARPPGAVNASHFFDTEQEANDWPTHAIVIASPVEYHARQFWTAVSRGVGCFVEKPLALSSNQFWRENKGPTGRMLAQDLEGDPMTDSPIHMIGYNLRFHEGMVAVKRELSRVGNPLHARFYIRCNRNEWPGTTYGSTLLECSHEIDAALWFLGPAKMLSASTKNAREWQVGLHHHNTDCITRVSIDDTFDGYDRGGEVVGTHGTIRWSWHAPSASFLMAGEGHSWSYSMKLAVTPDDTYAAELQTFLAAVTTGSRVRPSITDGLSVLEVVDWAVAHTQQEARTT